MNRFWVFQLVRYALPRYSSFPRDAWSIHRLETSNNRWETNCNRASTIHYNNIGSDNANLSGSALQLPVVPSRAESPHVHREVVHELPLHFRSHERQRPDRTQEASPACEGRVVSCKGEKRLTTLHAITLLDKPEHTRWKLDVRDDITQASAEVNKYIAIVSISPALCRILAWSLVLAHLVYM